MYWPDLGPVSHWNFAPVCESMIDKVSVQTSLRCESERVPSAQPVTSPVQVPAALPDEPEELDDELDELDEPDPDELDEHARTVADKRANTDDDASHEHL